jgi:ATP-dependent protease HslVU (ClpYQ) peptidase subunit
VNKKQWKELLPLLATLRGACDDIVTVKEGIETIRDQEQEKLDNMPENLQASEKGEKMAVTIEALTTIVDFDIEALIDAAGEVEGNQ